MKRYISIIVTLLFAVSVFAQDEADIKTEARQKYRQEELKYIESKNILSPEQFTKFSEAYTEYREGLKKIRQENAIMKPQDGEEVTEQQAKANVEAFVQKTIQRANLNKDYIEKLQGFMTNKQILKVQDARAKFKREKFKEIQNKNGK